jgi:CubicO group peptidase (beta-lactamase class C family)
VKKVSTWSLFILLGFFNFFFSCAQKKVSISPGLDKKIEGWLSESKVPAASVGIIENGKLKYLKAFGYSRKNVKAVPTTIFNIASMTKPVVAVLVLKLVESGQWNLQEPLSNYWIDPDLVNERWLKKLNTYHVLTHQTGFPNWRRNNKLAFQFEPGTQTQYSGEGFEYLKASLEIKFSTSLEKLLDSLLFKPLAMKRTSYWNDKLDTTSFAYWHDANGIAYNISHKTGANAADDLLTTAEDYCKFQIYVMNGAGLSKTLFTEMIRPFAPVNDHTAKGLGWEVINDLPGNEYALAHGGGDIGVKTMGIILPESRRGIVVFTNGDNGTSVYNKIISEAIDMGQTILDFNNGAYQGTVIKLDNNILDKYVGKYLRSDENKSFVIKREGNELKLTGEGLPMMILLPEAENKFFVKGSPYQFEFLQDLHEKTMKLRVSEKSKLLLDAKRIE